MRKLIDKIKSPKGIEIILELEEEKQIYILTIKSEKETKIFEGNIEEIQEVAHHYFINSLKELKNHLEITLLEELYKKS
ncbi:MAG TPA: hypothetical protein EYH43_00475 [Persephonella sp.]|nr:hypothetical protein [Hydrogenothermaceae bacterium]HIQ24443.1 hypothetical protein [Persephonella sp.]